VVRAAGKSIAHWWRNGERVSRTAWLFKLADYQVSPQRMARPCDVIGLDVAKFLASKPGQQQGRQAATANQGAAAVGR